jgi:hypothetical protein
LLKTTWRYVVEAAFVFTVAASTPSTNTRTAPQAAQSVLTSPTARPLNVRDAVAPAAVDERTEPPLLDALDAVAHAPA